MLIEKAYERLKLNQYESKGEFGDLNVCKSDDEYYVMWDDEIGKFHDIGKLKIIAHRKNGVGEIFYV